MVRLIIPLVAALLLTPGLSRGQVTPTRASSIFSGTVATTGTIVAAADASRTALICTNEDTTIAVFIGGSDVSTTGGVKVAGGASITLTNTGIVRARSASGAPTVSCIAERR
jgi:hypothetical protein